MTNTERKIIDLLFSSFEHIEKNVDLIHRNKKVELFLYPFQFSPVDLLAFFLLIEKKFEIKFDHSFIYDYGFLTIESIEKEITQLLEAKNGV